MLSYENNIDDNKMQNSSDSASSSNDAEQTKERDIERYKSENKDLKDNYIRLAADFENYKKRIVKDNERIIFNAQSSIILKFLPIIDNVSRFCKNAQNNTNEELKSWANGLMLVEKDINKILESLDIKEVQLNSFDPEIHEAIAYVPANGKSSGEIVDFVEKGYIFKGNLIRPAKVSIAQ